MTGTARAFALIMLAGCTSPSAPSGQLEPDTRDEHDEQECPETSDECSQADDAPDTGPRRVPMLDSGSSQRDAGVPLRAQDAGGDAALDAGGDAALDAGRSNMSADAGMTAATDAGARDAGGDAASDAGVDPSSACAQSTSRLAYRGDDELSYTGSGWIAEDLSLYPGSFAADDAGMMRAAQFLYPSGSREPLSLSARNLDAGFAPGVYMAAMLNTPGRPTFSLGDVSICGDTTLEIVEVEVRAADVDAGEPAQLRKLYARFDRRCYDGTRYNFLVGCFRYVAP